MKVIYKGPKVSMSITVPVGVKSIGKVRGVVRFSASDREKELDRVDAERLVTLDPLNFELAAPKERSEKVKK